MLKYCLDRYKTQEICDKVVDICLPTLNFLPDCFVTNEMLEKLDNIAFSIDDIDLNDADCDNVTLFSNDIGLVTIDLNNINIDDDNFEEEDPETIVLIRVIVWYNRYKQRIA